MSTRQSTIDFLLDQIKSGGAAATAKKMFGEYGLYCDGKIVALVCDDQLFVKPTAAGRTLIGEPLEKEPYPGAKPSFLIPGDQWEDHQWLGHLIRATAGALPPPKKKSRG